MEDSMLGLDQERVTLGLDRVGSRLPEKFQLLEIFRVSRQFRDFRELWNSRDISLSSRAVSQRHSSVPRYTETPMNSQFPERCVETSKSSEFPRDMSEFPENFGFPETFGLPDRAWSINPTRKFISQGRKGVFVAGVQQRFERCRVQAKIAGRRRY